MAILSPLPLIWSLVIHLISYGLAKAFYPSTKTMAHLQLEAMHKLQQETIQKQLMAQQLMLQQQARFHSLLFLICSIAFCPVLIAIRYMQSSELLLFFLLSVCHKLNCRIQYYAIQTCLPQGLAGGLTAQKKQREVYVGNLTIGVVTDNHLKELFNGALSHLVPDPHNNPPVVSAQLDPSGADLCFQVACNQRSRSQSLDNSSPSAVSQLNNAFQTSRRCYFFVHKSRTFSGRSEAELWTDHSCIVFTSRTAHVVDANAARMLCMNCPDPAN